MRLKKKTNDRLQQAVDLIKAGDNTKGRELLVQVLKSDPGNDAAWVWMAVVVEGDNLKKECLEEALKHNPRNTTARRSLEKLQAQGRITYSRTAVKPRRKRLAISPFAIPFVLVSLLMVYAAISEYPQDVAWKTENRATQARIVRLYYTIGRSSKRYAEYTYNVGGRRYTDESSTPYQDWKSMRVGQTIKIKYLPSDPGISQYYYTPEGTPEENRNGKLALAGGFLLLAFAFGVLPTILLRWIRKVLIKHSRYRGA